MKRIFSFLIRYVWAVFSCLYLFIFGVLFAKNRLLLSAICEHFGYGKWWNRDGARQNIRKIIPEMELSDIVEEHELLQLREMMEVYGAPSLLEIAVMNKLIKRHDPRVLFEVGTFNGRTTVNMASNCSQDAKVYTLDLPEELLDPGDGLYGGRERVGSRYLRADCREKIVQLYGDSSTFDFSPFVNVTDFIFIDANHSYGNVLKDSRTALTLLRNGHGVILWHNYDALHDGVVSALNELSLTDSEFKGLRHIKGTTLACFIAN
jgi:predicted O-methyltransferase YrrM